MKTFRLLALSAVLLAVLSPASAIPPALRLWEVSVVRFVIDEHGERWSERGMLDSFGGFRVTQVTSVLSTVTVPPEALDQLLISEDAWLSYGHLSPVALANFAAEPDGAVRYQIGFRSYLPITVCPEPKYDLGDLENISTRAFVAPGHEPMVGGFVIHHQSRRVLIRAVGPGLAPFGVSQPLADPYIFIYEEGLPVPVMFNDNWGERHDAAEIRQVAAEIGAFPLEDGSTDAAYLVELPPGAYTVHVTTFGTTGGTALLEVYAVP